MAESGLHKDASADNVHIPYAFTYADATARAAAAGLTVDDEGKFARQLDDDSIWMLTDYTGPTWIQIGSSLTLATVSEAGTGTNTTKAVTPAGLFPASVDVSSGSTTNIGGAASQFVRITGTTTITAFDSVASGIRRIGYFAGALTLTHNGTSLILPGAANITTAAGDSFEAISLGSGNWKVVFYQKADGTPIAGGGGGGGRTLIAENTPTGTGTTNFSIPSGHKKITIEFSIRSTVSADDCDGYIQFNSDTTAANYSYQAWRSNAFGTANDHGNSYVFAKSSIAGGTATANGFTFGKIELIQYDNSNFYKVANVEIVAWDNAFLQQSIGGVTWANTAAITSVDIKLSSGNFATNSVLRAYYED